MKNILFTLALLFCFNSFGQTAKEYIESGREKHKNEDYYGAIVDFTKAIEVFPNYAEAYYSRGISKGVLGDFNGSCADARKAKELDYDADELIELACQ